MTQEPFEDRRPGPPGPAGSGPRISAVVVSYNTRELTLAAIASLGADARDDMEVLVVDNASRDGSAEAIRQRFPRACVMESGENIGFGRANNMAFDEAQGEYVLLLNSDAHFSRPEDVDQLAAVLDREPRVGIVGPRLVDEAGRLEPSARRFPGAIREFVHRTGLSWFLPRRLRARWLLADCWTHQGERDVDWLTGACLLVRRRVIATAGGFDPQIFMYGEEQEWCHRVMQAGWRIRFDPVVSVVHRRAASSSASSWRMRQAMMGDLFFFHKHRSLLTARLFVGVRAAALRIESTVYGRLERYRRREYYRQRADTAAEAARIWDELIKTSSS